MSSKLKLSKEQKSALLKLLAERFEKNKGRHKGINWLDVVAKLDKNEKALTTLFLMEETGGEPDVTGFDNKSGTFIFCDCSPETPKGRRSICYDHEALESRKEHKPKNSAITIAAEIGVTILTEEQYQQLQTLGAFDSKTSSWLQTPAGIRELGGAIFGDRRFGRVFIYHNGAESYYGVRGFRGMLKV